MIGALLQICWAIMSSSEKAWANPFAAAASFAESTDVTIREKSPPSAMVAAPFGRVDGLPQLVERPEV